MHAFLLDVTHVVPIVTAWPVLYGVVTLCAAVVEAVSAHKQLRMLTGTPTYAVTVRPCPQVFSWSDTTLPNIAAEAAAFCPGDCEVQVSLTATGGRTIRRNDFDGQPIKFSFGHALVLNAVASGKPGVSVPVVEQGKHLVKLEPVTLNRGDKIEFGAFVSDYDGLQIVTPRLPDVEVKRIPQRAIAALVNAVWRRLVATLLTMGSLLVLSLLERAHQFPYANYMLLLIVGVQVFMFFRGVRSYLQAPGQKGPSAPQGYVWLSLVMPLVTIVIAYAIHVLTIS